MSSITVNRKLRRKRRISSELFGTQDRPRVSIFRSHKYLYAQAIDDENRQTVASVSTVAFKKESVKGKKSEQAKNAGLQLAQLLTEKKITNGVFDRGQYAYNGRVKAFAEGLREGKLTI